VIQNTFQGKIIIFFLFTLLHSSHTNALDFKAYGFIQPESSIYINGDGRHGQDNYNTSLFGKEPLFHTYKMAMPNLHLVH